MAPDNRQRSNENLSSGEMDSGSATAGKKSSRKGSLDKNSEAYRLRRERNNLAVKKSRSKSKMKTQETLERVNKLKVENEVLEAKIKLLSKELSFLKDLFLAHAGNAHGQNLQDFDLSMFGEPANTTSDQKPSVVLIDSSTENDLKNTVKVKCSD